MNQVLFRAAVLLICIFQAIHANAQTDKRESEMIKTALSSNVCPIDSEADAYIVSESKKISLNIQQFSSTYFYMMTETVHRIIKINRKSADHLGNFKIVYRNDGKRFYIQGFKAATYNLEGNEVKVTQLNKTDYYQKKVAKNIDEFSFTFPGLKEGSVIEYTYDLVTPYRYSLPYWEIQSEYPKLYTSYEVDFSKYDRLTSVTHTNLKPNKYQSKAAAENCADSFSSWSGEMYPHQAKVWVRRYVPAIKEETFVNNIPDHREYLVMEETSFNKIDTSAGKTTWDKLNEVLLDKHFFGMVLKSDNKLLDGTLQSIYGQHTDIADTVEAIYNYVRQTVSCDDDNNVLPELAPIETLEKKAGSNADINMLLCGLYLKAGYEAWPVLLSTRGNLSLTPAFPLIGRITHTICAVKQGSGYVLLDASDKNNYYGDLPAKCYNGFAWMVKTTGAGINLTSDVLREKSMTGIKVYAITDTAASTEIILKEGMIFSAAMRKTWAKDNKARQSFIDNLKSELSEDFRMTDIQIKGDQNPDTNLVITISGRLQVSTEGEATIINTNLLRRFAKNPFIGSKRTLPIEFPYQLAQQQVVTISLPDQMEPVNMPEPTIVNIDSNAMTYKKTYSHYAGMHTVTINSQYNRAVTDYPADRYTDLRSFYETVAKKENEVIVLKKTTK